MPRQENKRKMKKGDRASRVTAMQEDLDFVMPYIRVNPDDLASDMVQHVSSYVYLAQFAAEAVGQSADTKDAVTATKAQKFVEYKLGTADGKKYPTDETVKAAVEQDPEVQEARKEASDAKMDEVFWNYVMDAFQQRGFLIKELASQGQQNRTDSSRVFNMETTSNLQHTRLPQYGDDDFEPSGKDATQLTKESMIETMRQTMGKSKNRR